MTPSVQPEVRRTVATPPPAIYYQVACDHRLREGLHSTLADNSEPADIFETVRRATVVITGLNREGERVPIGSGFFAAPGLLLSCAHVVAPARDLRIEWQGKEFPADVACCEPDAADPDGHFPPPDVALLRVDVEAPCAPLSRTGPRVGDQAWAPGITQIRTLKPERYASWLTVADLDHGTGLFRLTGDTVGQGMSGGPVLDVTTFEVCGTFKSELDTICWAVPLDLSLSVLNEQILDENLKAFPNGLPALRLRQKAFEPHARWVSNVVEGAADAQAQLRAELDGRRLHPELIAERAFPEWAARQLFELTISDLHQVLRSLITMLRDEQLVKIFQVIACCHEGRDGSETWISGSASDALSKEFAEQRPRAVRLTAKENESADAMLRRAFLHGFHQRLVCGPVSADPADDTARELVAIYLTLAGYRDPSEWTDWDSPAMRERIRASLVRDKGFALIGLDSAPDDAWFRELAEQFQGFPLMFRGHDLTPSGPDELILDLRPPIDRFLERDVTNFLSLLAGSDN